MAYSAYLPAYSALPGMTNSQYRLQQQQEQEYAAQNRAQQAQAQLAGQPQAYANPEYAAQQGYGQYSAQYRLQQQQYAAQQQQYGAQQQQYGAAPAGYQQQVLAAQPHGAARAYSNSNLATAIGYSRPIGNGTAGNIEEHRNALQSVHYLDRGYNQF